MATPHGARAVAAIITAPLTVGVRVVENGPEIAGRIRQELTLARFIGKMAVDQGRRELQRRLDGDVTVDRHSTVAVAPPEEDRLEPAVEARVDAPVDAPVADEIPEAEDLALDDYDQLPAAQIVAKLGSLTAAERSQIRRYEAAHRHRRTVLGKLGQLDA